MSESDHRVVIQDGDDLVVARTIPKVPWMHRRISFNRECYDPLVVSIGPYHHGKEQLDEMQRFKDAIADRFLHGSTKPIEVWHKEVAEAVGDPRKYYDDQGPTEIFQDINAFTHMMFLDGCFILNFVFCLLRKPEDLKMTSHFAALVKRDLFLLENQIPFKVLKSLMNLRFPDGEEELKLFQDFIKLIRAMPPPGREPFRESISKFCRQHRPRLANSNSPDDMKNDDQPAHLLELFHTHFVSSKVPAYDTETGSMYEDDSWMSWYQNYPAEELKKVGINFNPTSSSSFTDIHFKSTWFGGTLEIPPLSIDESTKPLLLNLIVYEACLNTPSDWVTSYVCFMDSLIDYPEDVKELRARGIVLNDLGNDQEVADIFKQIAKYIKPNPYAHFQVKKDIESHYRNTIKRWIMHYKGPVSAAVVKYSFLCGLLISALQAYISMKPSA